MPASTRNVTLARGRKPRPEKKEPLRKRRKKARKAFFVALSFLAILLLAALLYVCWLPALRVTEVSASGPHAEEARALALSELSGTHFLVLPRNSLFLVPEDAIRARILEEHPDIEAVSISAAGLTTLAISAQPRAEAFVWCGASREVPEASCYRANAEGLIFAALPPEAASTTPSLRIYAPIIGREGVSAVRAHIEQAARIPDMLRFVKALETLGADIASLSVRADEADLHTAGGTRITYLIGKEVEAAGIAASVFPQLKLNDGSVEYLDLRFEGKAYFKRSGQEASGEE